MIAEQPYSDKSIISPELWLEGAFSGINQRVVIGYTNGPNSSWEHLKELLTRLEIDLYSRHRGSDDFLGKVYARTLLRLTLCKKSRVHAHEIDLQRGIYGKPFYASGPYFNVSHTAGAFCIVTHRNAVGIDIEHLTRNFDVLAMSEKFFTANELNLIKNASDPFEIFFKIWTLKESYMKAKGLGFNLAPQSLETTIDQSGQVRFWEGSATAASPFVARTFATAKGYVGAVCSIANDAPQIIEINLPEQLSIFDSCLSSSLQLAAEHLLPNTET